ncbi:MAG TPA: alpha/beta hydrolase [Vicinamibacteria bacterium]|nr:alpha/beta hydrolase [Vicinamibacteria bacterium]
MATPTLTQHRLPGTLGPIHVDVRAPRRDVSRPAVVAVHGFKGFKDWGFFPATADRLARAGFAAVSLDLSGSGVERGEFVHPERFFRNTHRAEIADVATVLAALGRGELGIAPPSSVGILAHSRGGVGALANATRPEVRALVTWAAIGSVLRWDPATRARWRAEGRMDVVNARTGQVLPVGLALLDEVEREHVGALDLERLAAEVAAPWLIIHGTGDESVSFLDAELLAEASGRATTKLLAIEGAGHTFGIVHPWQGPTPMFDRVLSESLAWFATHLP